MARCLAALYIVSVFVLAVAAIAIWRLRCEGFGCTGVGIAWLGWVAVYLVALIAGVAVRARPDLGARLARASSAALVFQVVLGVGLALVWASRSAA